MQILVYTDRHIGGDAQFAEEVEAAVGGALRRYRERITRVQVFFRDENSDQKFGDADKRCTIEARLGGMQPVTVSHQGASLDQALNGATDKLLKSLKRTLGRKGSLFQRQIRARADLAAAGPALQQEVETGKQDEFVKLLRPLLGYLVQHAHREMRILEANGSLEPGQIDFENLLDDVVARAWLQFADRPRGMELDLWLTKLLDQLLEERVERLRPRQGTPRQAPAARPRDMPQVGEQQWWAWLLGEGDDDQPEGQIPSRQRTWAEEYLEAEELMDRIHSILGDLPKVQRHAFVLHILEAYELPEIAMLQDRPEAEIRSDIEAARSHLRQRLTAGAESLAAADSAPEGT